jgi:hypothetical protein
MAKNKLKLELIIEKISSANLDSEIIKSLLERAKEHFDNLQDSKDDRIGLPKTINLDFDKDPHDKDPHDKDPNDFDRDNFDRDNFSRFN